MLDYIHGVFLSQLHLSQITFLQFFNKEFIKPSSIIKVYFVFDIGLYRDDGSSVVSPTIYFRYANIFV